MTIRPRLPLGLAGLALLLLAAADPARAQNQTPPAAAPPSATPPSATPPQSDALPPPEPYTPGRPGATPPRVVSQAKPAYTPEAIRARIEGSVRVRGIVERDGTVSNIEVTQSLDAVNGLDQSAMTALRQWRFEPGTVNGQPVRMMVNVDMRFSLADLSPEPAWPPDFTTAAAAPAAAGEPGVDEVVETGGFRLALTHPASWFIRKTGRDGEWAALHNSDNTQSIVVQTPRAVTYELTAPIPRALIESLAAGLRQALPVQSQPELIAAGQIEARPGMLWAWSSLRVGAIPTPAGVPAASNPFGEGRLWVFSHTIAGTGVGVMCQVLLPRGDQPAADTDARVRRAAADCQAVVKSISIDKLPG